jgi:hypothetical protein
VVTFGCLSRTDRIYSTILGALVCPILVVDTIAISLFDFPTPIGLGHQDRKRIWLCIRFRAGPRLGSICRSAKEVISRLISPKKRSANLVLRPDGTWFVFSGDQLGSLFAAWTLEGYKASGRPIGMLCHVYHIRRSPSIITEKLAMVASTVSSKLIGAMAAKEGFKFVESLTGMQPSPSKALD